MRIITTSWDDGFKESLDVAKLLRKYKLAGTFYIPIVRMYPEWFRSWRAARRLLKYKSGGMHEGELRELSSRFEIGAHGVTHKPLTEISHGQTMGELELSKEFLEHFLCIDVHGFAYPQGRHNDRTINQVKLAGYDYARTTVDGKLNFSDKFRMPVTAFCGSNLIGKLKFSILSSANDVYAFGGDWEKSILKAYRAMLRKGGVLHIAGHPQDWCPTFKEKLERVFAEISDNPYVKYLTNWEVANGLAKASTETKRAF